MPGLSQVALKTCTFEGGSWVLSRSVVRLAGSCSHWRSCLLQEAGENSGYLGAIIEKGIGSLVGRRCWWCGGVELPPSRLEDLASKEEARPEELAIREGGVASEDADGKGSHSVAGAHLEAELFTLGGEVGRELLALEVLSPTGSG